MARFLLVWVGVVIAFILDTNISEIHEIMLNQFIVGLYSRFMFLFCLGQKEEMNIGLICQSFI